MTSLSTTAAARGLDAWNDGWDAFDARQPAAARVAVAALKAAKPRRRGWFGLLVLALALPVAWFAGPALIAADILRGLDRQDSAALTDRVDWAAVTSTLATALRDAGGRDHGAGASRFLDGLATDMATAWHQPEARAMVLADRGVALGSRLQSARLEDFDRLVLDLGRDAGDAPALRVTMSLTDPGRLGWAVTALRFSDAAAPAGAVPQAAVRPRMVAF